MPLLLLYSLLFPQITSGGIQLKLKNIDTTQGNIRIAVYDNPQAFEQQGETVYGTVIAPLTSPKETVLIPQLGYGTYVIAVYHDVNNNGKLDKTLLGIPKEPYAFSNNPVVKWSPPTYAACSFELQTKQLQLEIRLQSWAAY